MPYEQLDIQQVAEYLHMDTREIVKLASRGQIPARKVRGQFLFRKGEVDHWVETQMHTFDGKKLAEIEKGVSAHHGFDHDRMLVCGLIPEDPMGIAVPLGAKTREAAIRALVSLADHAQLLYAPDKLIQEIRTREELCSTGFIPQVALPHPRHPLPYDIAASFVVAGLTPSGIPYGAQDGKLTRLFFMICAKDERTHLHVLARLVRMLDEHQTVTQMIHAESPDRLREIIEDREKAVLNGGG